MLNLLPSTASQDCVTRAIPTKVVIGEMLQIRRALRHQVGELIVAQRKCIGIYYVQGIQSGTEPVDPCLHVMRC